MSNLNASSSLLGRWTLAPLAICAAFSAFSCAGYTEQAPTDGEEERAWDFGRDELLPGASCAPSRAVGAVSTYEAAFLEMIAEAEGTRDRGGADGYNVLFSHRTISDCTNHPRRTICAGRYCSTAAGRYQFLTNTWKSLRLPTFKPENQERGAVMLIKRRRATLPTDRAMSAVEFRNVLDRVSYEWASLPPGRYGQPMKSVSFLRTAYCNEVECR